MFCIPNSIENSKGVGTNNLIKKGAKLVQLPQDVMQTYGVNANTQITIEELEKNNQKVPIDLNEIPEEYREIYKILYEPLSVNELSSKLKIEVTEVYSILFMMELEGLIKKYENKYVIA